MNMSVFCYDFSCIFQLLPNFTCSELFMLCLQSILPIRFSGLDVFCVSFCGYAEMISPNFLIGLERQEMTFNLAAGLGLLSLIAASKTELEKTVELRKQMEIFLQSFKEEHHSQGTTPKPSGPEVAYAVSTTIDGCSNYSTEDHAPSFSHQDFGNNFAFDTHYHMHQKVESVGGINHLEEELAAELDRLQLDVETGDYTKTEESSEIQEQVTEVQYF